MAVHDIHTAYFDKCLQEIYQICFKYEVLLWTQKGQVVVFLLNISVFFFKYYDSDESVKEICQWVIAGLSPTSQDFQISESCVKSVLRWDLERWNQETDIIGRVASSSWPICIWFSISPGGLIHTLYLQKHEAFFHPELTCRERKRNTEENSSCRSHGYVSSANKAQMKALPGNFCTITSVSCINRLSLCLNDHCFRHLLFQWK